MLGPFAATHELRDGRRSRRTTCTARGGTTSRSATTTCTGGRAERSSTAGRSTTRARTRGANGSRRSRRACRGRGSSSTISTTGAHTFHRLAPSREFVDLPLVSARGLTTEEVDAAIADVRRVVPGRDRRQDRAAGRARPAAPHRARARSQGAARVQARALHFHLDTRRPEIIRSVRARCAGPPAVARRHRARQAARARCCRPTSIAMRWSSSGCAISKDAEERDSPLRDARRRGSGCRCGSTAFASRTSGSTCDTASTFDTGLTGIIGPNGSGKIDAARGDRVGAVRPGLRRAARRESMRFMRAGAARARAVELDFELGGHRYRVVRGLTTAELYLDGADAPIANSITGVTDLLQRRLGMSPRRVLQHVLHGAEGADVMAAMGPPSARSSSRACSATSGCAWRRELVRERRSCIAAETAGLRSGDAGRRTSVDAPARRRERAARDARSARARRQRRASRPRESRAGRASTPRWDARAARARAAAGAARRAARRRERGSRRYARDVERVGRELAERADGARTELAALATELAPLAALARRVAAAASGSRARKARRQTLRRDASARSSEELRRAARAPRHASRRRRRWRRKSRVELGAKRAELEEVEGELEARARSGCATGRKPRRSAMRCATQYAEVREQRDQLVELGEDGTCPDLHAPARRSLPRRARPARRAARDDHGRRAVLKHAARAARGDARRGARSSTSAGARADRRKSGTLERRLAKVQARGAGARAARRATCRRRSSATSTVRRELRAIPPATTRRGTRGCGVRSSASRR